jgi:hypothetical protein
MPGTPGRMLYPCGKQGTVDEALLPPSAQCRWVPLDTPATLLMQCALFDNDWEEYTEMMYGTADALFEGDLYDFQLAEEANPAVRLVVWDADRLFEFRRDFMSVRGRDTARMFPNVDMVVLKYDDITRDTGCVTNFLNALGMSLTRFIVRVMYAEDTDPVVTDVPDPDTVSLVLPVDPKVIPKHAAWVSVDIPQTWDPLPIMFLPTEPGSRP